MKWTERPAPGLKHFEERLKLAASGVHAGAITVLAAGVLAPR